MKTLGKACLLLWGCLIGMQGFSLDNESGRIRRMGNAGTESFDEGWLFMRYGLQPDGTSLAEPAGVEKTDWDDSNWTALDLPHDFAIGGPVRIELAGESG